MVLDVVPDGLDLSLVRLHLLVIAGLHFELLVEHLGLVVMRVALLRLVDEKEEKERGAEQQQSGLDVNVEVVDGRSVVPEEPEHQKAVRDRDDAEDRVAQPVDPAVFDGPQLGDDEGCGS